MKYFTVEEAQALLPRLEKIFAAVEELSAQAEAKAAVIRKLQSKGSDPADLAIARSQLQFLAQSANEKMQEIVELGAFPKGLDPALVDFPCRLEGRESYLCWKRGEPRIAYWHGADEGFSGRKPLPRRR